MVSTKSLFLSLAPLLFTAVSAHAPQGAAAAVHHPRSPAPLAADGRPVLMTELGKRDSNTTYLPNIVSFETPACQATCATFVTAVKACLSSGSEEGIAVCTCGTPVLTLIETCSQCIISDKANNKFGNQPLYQYNGFVNQCIAVGLAPQAAIASVEPEQPASTASARVSQTTAAPSVGAQVDSTMTLSLSLTTSYVTASTVTVTSGAPSAATATPSSFVSVRSAAASSSSSSSSSAPAAQSTGAAASNLSSGAVRDTVEWTAMVAGAAIVAVLLG